LLWGTGFYRRVREYEGNTPRTMWQFYKGWEGRKRKEAALFETCKE